MLRRRKANNTANIYDVAREAKVSVFTVSTVINKRGQVSPPLQRRVDAAIQKLNYRPNLLARGLAKSRTHTIGIVVPDISNPFFPLVVRGVEDVTQKHGYSVLLCNSDDRHDKEELYLELLLSKRVDGILLCKAPGAINSRLRQALSDARIPIVLLDRTCPSLSKDAVATDDQRGAFEAVSHLARLGYRKIALVGGPLNVSSGRARWRGYRRALKENGLRYDSDLVFEGNYRIDSGYRAGLALLPRRPEAVFVANYLMTVGFMKAAQELGMRCPEDFGLVSVDDFPWLGCFQPRLSTVDLPKYEMGAVAAELLLDRLSGKRVPMGLRRLAPQLLVRESCGFKLRLQEPVVAKAE